MGIPLFRGVFVRQLMPERLLGIGVSRMGRAGVSGTREGEKEKFDQGFHRM